MFTYISDFIYHSIYPYKIIVNIDNKSISVNLFEKDEIRYEIFYGNNVQINMLYFLKLHGYIDEITKTNIYTIYLYNTSTYNKFIDNIISFMYSNNNNII